MDTPLEQLRDVYINYQRHEKELSDFPNSQLSQVLGTADGELHYGLAFLTLLDVSVWNLSIYDWQLLERDFRHMEIGCPFTLERFVREDGKIMPRPISSYGMFTKKQAPFDIPSFIDAIGMKVIAESMYTNGHIQTLEVAVEDTNYVMLHNPEKKIIGIPRYPPSSFIALPARPNSMYYHFNKRPQPGHQQVA